jgi:hypothetical protein
MSCSLCGQKVDLDLPDDALDQELCRRCWDERVETKVYHAINRRKVACDYCWRTVLVDNEPEPEDEAICVICEDNRNDARRDEADDAKREERWADGEGR